MNQWLHTNDILSCTACCFWGTVFSHWWGHLKLRHRFHAPTKVCSNHCPFKPCICIICRHRLVAWSIRIRCWTRVARGSNHHLTRTRDSRRILWTSWRLWGLKTSASGSFPSCTIASKARFKRAPAVSNSDNCFFIFWFNTAGARRLKSFWNSARWGTWDGKIFKKWKKLSCFLKHFSFFPLQRHPVWVEPKSK